MTLSKKQLEANRLNAKKGGVKTEQGKNISKYNAMKHGILSREVLMGNEDEQELLDLSRKVRKDLAPNTEMEHLLVDRIIANMWRLKRTLQIEKKTMSWLYKAERFGFLTYREGWEEEVENDEHATRQMLDNNVVEKITRYETAIERSIFRALHELQRLRGENTSPPTAIDVFKDE